MFTLASNFIFCCLKLFIIINFQQNFFEMKTVEPKQHLNMYYSNPPYIFSHYYMVSVGVSIKICGFFLDVIVTMTFRIQNSMVTTQHMHSVT